MPTNRLAGQVKLAMPEPFQKVIQSVAALPLGAVEDLVRELDQVLNPSDDLSGTELTGFDDSAGRVTLSEFLSATRGLAESLGMSVKFVARAVAESYFVATKESVSDPTNDTELVGKIEILLGSRYSEISEKINRLGSKLKSSIADVSTVVDARPIYFDNEVSPGSIAGFVTMRTLQISIEGKEDKFEISLDDDAVEKIEAALARMKAKEAVLSAYFVASQVRDLTPRKR